MFLRLELIARRAVISVGLGLVVLTSLIPSSARAESPVLTPQAWCALIDPPVSADVARADSVMSGRIDLGKFGYYTLASDPQWKYQSSTDLAGNRGINSLEWVSPVIAQGIARGDEKMVARARELIYDWSADNPVTRPYGDTDQPLIAGKRIIALNCAATMLNDQVIQGMASAEAGRMQAMSTSWGAPNNTDLYGYAGLLFNACFTADDAQRNFAESKVNQVTRALVNKDGSDIEGSPAYANYTALLLADTLRIMDGCNLNSDVVSSRRQALLSFVAYTIRPNFTWETIGDSTAERITTFSNPLPSPLFWAASRSNGGVAPQDTYSVFPDGGYLFARSAWSSDATFYSLRAKPRAATTPHAHDDATGFTLFSQGVQWIGDPGPFRYDKSVIRSNIIKRAAHSALSIEGIRTVSRGGFAKAVQDVTGDTTCVRDNPHVQITMTRCVQYLRATDTFIITDRLIDRRRAKSPKVSWVQRFQIPPGVTTTPLQTGNGFALASGTASVELSTDSGAKLSLIPGGAEGFGLFTGKYGELSPGSTITRKYQSRGKTDVSVVTTIRPGAQEVSSG